MQERTDHRGIVVRYDPERGFGFIRSSSFPDDVFVHASVILGNTPLRAGQRVRFSAEAGEKGPRASLVEPGRVGFSPLWAGVLGLSSALLVLMFGLRWLGVPWLWSWLVAFNLVAPLVFTWDKHRALREGRRVPESVLLLFAALGASPAAALTMRLIRHKTRKGRFLAAFWGIVVLQILALTAWFAAG